MSEGEFVAAHVFWFVDRIEGYVLHRGSKSDCERVLCMCPGAIAPPEVMRAESMCCPAQEWDEYSTDG